MGVDVWNYLGISLENKSASLSDSAISYEHLYLNIAFKKVRLFGIKTTHFRIYNHRSEFEHVGGIVWSSISTLLN